MNPQTPRKIQRHKSSILYNNIKQVAGMKDIRRIKLDMERVNSIIKMEDTMMEIGKTIKCLDGENSTTRAGN